MNIREPHPWNQEWMEWYRSKGMTPEGIQVWLRGRVTMKMPPDPIKHVAWADCSNNPGAAPDLLYSAVVVHTWPGLEHVETRCATIEAPMDYTPGLLGFREVPAILAAMRKLDTEPDMMIMDAHGLSHPRYFGAASHLGVILRKPTIGVAKKLLHGRLEDGIVHTDGLRINMEDEYIEAIEKLELDTPIACRFYPTITAVLVDDLYVSVGNMITLQEAVAAIRYIIGKSRDLMTAAHVAAKKYRRANVEV